MEAETVYLSWPAASDAQHYRVVVRDMTDGGVVLRLLCTSNEYHLPLADLDPNRRYEWKVQVQRTGRWEDWQPYLAVLLPPRDPTQVTRITWPGGAAADALYRVVIHDGHTIVVKDVVAQTHYDVDWSRLGSGTFWRYRVQTRGADGSWVDLLPYRPLHAPTRSQPSAVPRNAAAQGGRQGELLFLFTVDTEANIRYMPHPDYARAVDEHIFGHCATGRYGIELMMDMLEAVGIKGTFFVDVLLHYQFGREGLERTVAKIQERGHDVQLHLHAEPHLYYALDPELRAAAQCLRSQESEDFARVLEIAVRCFEDVVGRPPIAYRAGSYRIHSAAFARLRRLGIRIDSSIYPFKHCQVPQWMAARTRPFWVNGVLEVPVSWLIERRGTDLRARQFNLNTSIAPAILSALQTPCPFAVGPRTLVFMAHSYTLLREERTHDPEVRRRWNDEFAAIAAPDIFALCHQKDPNNPLLLLDGPYETRIAMLQAVLQQVAKQPTVRAVTMREIHDHWLIRLGVNDTPVEPVALWDVPTKQLRWVGLRRYAADWLTALESENPPNQASLQDTGAA